MLVTDCICWCTFHVFVFFLELMPRNKPNLHEGLASCLFRISGSVFTVKSLEPVKEAEVMNSYDSLCAAHLLLLTSALLQVQLFWSLRLGWSQHQYSSILHRSGKHRLAASNIHKYQWLDAGECKWIQFKKHGGRQKSIFHISVLVAACGLELTLAWHF